MIFDKHKEGIVLRVRLSPNSSSCGVRGIFVSADGLEYIKISVIAVPEKGKANKELIDFLSKEFRVAKKDIDIIHGETDKYKQVLFRNVSEEDFKLQVMKYGS